MGDAICKADLLAIRAQRAAALVREVSLLARLPTPSLGGGMGGLGGLLGVSAMGSGRVGMEPMMGARGGDAGASLGLGPARRDVNRQRAKPYERPNLNNLPPQKPISRTASTVSFSHLSTDGADDDQTAATTKEKAGVSPLSSPCLESCISSLSTPELLGVVFGNNQRNGLSPFPPPLDMPSSLLTEANDAKSSNSSPSEAATDDTKLPCPSPPPTANDAQSGRASPTPERKPYAESRSLLQGSSKAASTGETLADSSPSLTCMDVLRAQ